uniref:Laminin G domain-containing protein n=1 Tax=Malurus cyaneus samueli TaxID=2593467 RepID=A0A8C5TN59_9PASS
TRSSSKCPHDNIPGRPEYVATFRGSEFFCYDVSRSPVQSSADELALAFRTRQRHGLLLHTGRAGAVWLVINLGAGAFEALVEPVNGKFHDGGWHHVASRATCAGTVGGALGWDSWSITQLGSLSILLNFPTGSTGSNGHLAQLVALGYFGQRPDQEIQLP